MTRMGLIGTTITEKRGTMSELAVILALIVGFILGNHSKGVNVHMNITRKTEKVEKVPVENLSEAEKEAKERGEFPMARFLPEEVRDYAVKNRGFIK